MKKLFTLAAFGIAASIYAQSNVDLKKEIDDIKTSISNLQKEVEAIKNENLYYKKTLDINKPISQGTSNDLEFTVTNVTANRKDKTLMVTYIYKNITNEVRKEYQPSQAYIVDDRGNQTSTYEVFAAKDNKRVEQIQPGVPMKGLMKFKIDETDFPVIKLLHLQFPYVGKEFNPKSQNVAFKDLPVTWE